MEKQPKILYETESLCPYCLKKIDAAAVEVDDSVYLVKNCVEHGEFSTIIWRGSPDINKWKIDKIPSTPKNYAKQKEKGCPFDCGLCQDHKQHTCTVLIEVTKRCNLNCNICFADSGSQSCDPGLDKIKFYYERVLSQGGPFNLQISGGEPTVRDDLPEIIKMGRDYGFDFIQLNTNGIRIAQEENYAGELKAAELNSIFLQFDSTNDEIYKKSRGRELFELKKKAVENCRKHGLGIMLVPVIWEDNLKDTGKIIKFALDNIDIVRGVHFQPLSCFGRYPENMQYSKRITLPEIIQSMEAETKGMLKSEYFSPPCCEHSLCSFHGNFIYEQGMLQPIVKKSCCGNEKIVAEVGAQKSRQFVKKFWNTRDIKLSDVKQDRVSMSFDKILSRINNRSFSISGMAFQDAWNIDLERVKQCCIHVMSEDGNLIPFCLYNLTDINSNYLYRRR